MADANKIPAVAAPEKSAKAVAKHLKASPRKVRLVIDTIRRKPVKSAFQILGSIKGKGARLAEKVLKSAAANAKVLGMDEQGLYVDSIFADGGPVFKRFMERSQGRADRILKRTMHLSVILKEGKKSFAGPSSERQEKEEVKSIAEIKKRKQKFAAAKK